MIIVEYEAKNLLAARGLPVPPGAFVTTAAEAEKFSRSLGDAVVIKVQIPAGGRMKAGGVQFAHSSAEVKQAADQLLGQMILGYPVECLLVEQRLDIETEVFVAVTYEDSARSAVLLASTEGGIEIESAGQFIRREFSVSRPFLDYEGREVASELGFKGRDSVQLGAIITGLVNCFIEWDTILLECNPVVLDTAGQWWIADVHFDLDDDALYRQKALLDAAEYSCAIAERRSNFEQQAHNLDKIDPRGAAGRLVALEGNIGMLIGGGGASLTAMDALLDAGFKPANYSEIGGNPSVWKIKELTKIVLSQPRVDKLLVIMNVVSNTRVDLIARGVIKGILELGREPKEVISAFRIPGSWEAEGVAILEHYGVRYFGRETTIDQVVEVL
jgi:succinyl-CoA synthetase beta subunit/citryl-CoA synthetase large subunit